MQALSIFLLVSFLWEESLESMKTPWCVQSPVPFIAICCLLTLYSGVFQLIMEVSPRLTVTNNLMSSLCSISKYKDPINATDIWPQQYCEYVCVFINSAKTTS